VDVDKLTRRAHSVGQRNRERCRAIRLVSRPNDYEKLGLVNASALRREVAWMQGEGLVTFERSSTLGLFHMQVCFSLAAQGFKTMCRRSGALRDETHCVTPAKI
jgi:hypothetical protein